MKKFKVHSFENGIYRPRLYVVVDDRWDEIAKNFEECNGNPLDFKEVDNLTLAVSYTAPVHPIATTKEWGFLVVFRSKKLMDIPTIAHECFHATCDYADLIGIDYVVKGTNEAWAYLLEWMVKCCMEVKNFKK